MIIYGYNRKRGKEKMSKQYRGTCIKCEALLEWEEVFTFSNYQNIIVYG